MEEEKAAALYEELTRKGGGAARFKQGLGFSSATTPSNDPPSRGSALPSSSSSFMSNFVRASTQTKEIEVDKKTQIENIQNKLKKKEPISSTDKIRVRDKDRRRSSSREKNLRSRSRSRSRSRERRRSRSRSRSRGRRKRSTSRDREKNSRSRRRHSTFDEDRDRSRRRYRSSSRERRRKRSRGRSRSRSRSFSPSDRKRSERRRDGGGRDTKMVKESSNGTIDYPKSIDGYDNMTPAERVKAKMKLQLSQTAQKDTNLGSGSQWERFEFNKDAPVDDNEIEAADDDATLVKHIGRSFRFTSLEAKREDEIENAHDQAIFGVPAPIPSYTSETVEERASENKNANENKGSTDDDDPASSLISEKVLSKQQGSWRDRARKNVG